MPNKNEVLCSEVSTGNNTINMELAVGDQTDSPETPIATTPATTEDSSLQTVTDETKKHQEAEARTLPVFVVNIETSNDDSSQTSVKQSPEIDHQEHSGSKSSEAVKRPAPDTSGPGLTNDLLQEIGSETVTLVNDSIVLEPDLKRKKVDIFVEDPKPKWYNAVGCNISKTIDPQKLVEAFSFLPIIGRPQTKSALKEYQESKIKDFVGSGLNDDEFAKLAVLCSPDNLKTGKELEMPTCTPNQGVGSIIDSKDPRNIDNEPGAHELCMVKKLKMRMEKDINNTYSKKLKYRGIRIMPFTEDDSPMVTLGSPLQPGKDLLYRIRLYRPFPHTLKDKVGPSRFRHSIFSCDVVILGRQKLYELRDRIVCPNDVDMRLDVSDRYDETPSTTAKDVFPSGFLFINNTFYVDTRPGCGDISSNIRAWAADKPGLGHFPKKDMDIRLDQINIKLGHPEVYMHQGNCEHLFTFSEMRLLNASDPLKISQYPSHTAISQYQSMYCTTCAEFAAKWIVTECDRVPFDPAFFCEACFSLYMFNNGKKIGSFKAFSYRGNELNMLKPQG